MNTNFYPLDQAVLAQIMPIEQACHSHPWSEKLFKSCLTERYFNEYLMVEQTIVGFYVADYVAGEASLMDICVAPEFQGKGYGKLLMLRCIEHAKQKQAEQLFLEVRASNTTAQMLYINTGFVQVGRRSAYYPKQVGYEDAIVMQLTL